MPSVRVERVSDGVVGSCTFVRRVAVGGSETLRAHERGGGDQVEWYREGDGSVGRRRLVRRDVVGSGGDAAPSALEAPDS
jgi:hypothetical protein